MPVAAHDHPAPVPPRRAVEYLFATIDLMYAVVTSAAVIGVQAILVRVEAYVSGGLPSFTIVGLPGAAVQESRERVRAALKQLGLPLAPSRIVVNLAPADVRKQGPAFDLPIALAVLAADGHLPTPALQRVLAVGELALDGGIRPVTGAVSVGAVAAEAGLQLLTSLQSAGEAAVVPNVDAVGADSLAQAVAHLRGRQRLTSVTSRHLAAAAGTVADLRVRSGLDLADVKGHAAAKRLLEVAAAGRHNVLFTGPPGAGKTMLALRLQGLLPPLSVAHALEVSRVRSSAGLASGAWLDPTPPFRQPHHSASEAGILGGGAIPRPGEASLAHRGVLFLDELPEFSRTVLESLRQPLEAGMVVLTRAAGAVALPADFQLVAARNPCPCGRLGDASGPGCQCTPEQLRRYERSVSAPLLDRIDLRMNLPRLSEDELVGSPAGETSAVVGARVAAARAVMLARQGCVNAALAGAELRTHATPESAAQPLLRTLVRRLDLSGRGFDRLLRVARTVADLAAAPTVGAAHLAEAAAYRAV